MDEDLIVDIVKEKENSKDKLKKCLKNIEISNNNYKKIKDFITEINDFMIVK